MLLTGFLSDLMPGDQGSTSNYNVEIGVSDNAENFSRE
jgi:hypothetical protein